MVEINAGDDGDGRRENVGGIEAPAETDFEHAKFNSLASKRFERHGGHALEISGMRAQFAGGEKFFDQNLYARENFCEQFVINLFSINANAFVDFFKVRRSIEPSSKPGLAHDGLEERRG